MKKGIGVVIVVLLAIGIWLFWMIPGERIHKAQQFKADGTYDYAVILGAKVNGEVPSLSLRYRLEEALAYANRYPNVKFVLSGGQGLDEDISEAEAMYRYLTLNGVAVERLILEDQSTSTYENLLYSQELLPEVAGVTIISSDFHLARARFLARQIGWDADVVAAKTPEVVKMKVLVRERFALFKTWVFRK
ncbi:vancomycin resistance protein [Sporosarcina sp. P13]|uniref:YdcF family protein n=1 Tax=Sporosarcina sp. P13 TaxID=2048263 RepID=UPI000C173105|nr:YdcF family protein [Sporosarcina sp. P13]PIC62887.1 vancomycin resistance protein [Sporosarcina sp. P13]